MASAQIEKHEEEQQGPSLAETVQGQMEQFGFSKGDKSKESGEDAASAVGTKADDAKQALKEKYDTGKEAIVEEKNKAEENSSKGSGTGLEDAKAMLREEYEDAKKSIERNAGGDPQGADAHDTVKENFEQGKNKAGEMVQSAEEKLESSDAGAPEDSLKTLDDAKSHVGQKADEVKKDLSSDAGAPEDSLKTADDAKSHVGQKADEVKKDLSSHPTANNETQALNATKSPLGKITEAFKNAFSSSPKPEASPKSEA